MGQYDFSVVWRNLPFLGRGMALSLELTAVATLGGVLLGTALTVLRLGAPAIAGTLVAGYVNLFRSIPLILVIFWFYFLVPFIVGRPIGPLYSAIVTFIIFEGAYYSEIIRAGVQSVPRGQMAAAQAAGMTFVQGMSYVVLPQAFRSMIPVLLNQAITLFQDTSLVYVVALRDFMTSGSIIATRDYRPVEVYTFTAFVYLVMCSLASLGVQRLRSRLRRGSHALS